MEYTCTSFLDKFKKHTVWSFHFKIPDTIALALLKTSKRVVCVINNDVSYQCGLLSAGDLGYFVNVNATIRKAARIELNDRVSLFLKSDTSKYGLPVPEVFLELLTQDDEFEEIFHALTHGKQRSLIHLVGTFKSERKQMEQTMCIREYLLQVKGKLDYKELNLAFKNSRYK